VSYAFEHGTNTGNCHDSHEIVSFRLSLLNIICSRSTHFPFYSHLFHEGMRVSTLAAAQAGLLNVLPAAAEYVWPSKHDRMEDLLVLQGGYIREGFVDGM